MTAVGNCHFCGEPVNTGTSVAWPVTGWEAERSQGGANRIIYRQRVHDGRVAHTGCAETKAALERRGINDEQASLI